MRAARDAGTIEQAEFDQAILIVGLRGMRDNAWKIECAICSELTMSKIASVRETVAARRPPRPKGSSRTGMWITSVRPAPWGGPAGCCDSGHRGGLEARVAILGTLIFSMP